MKNFYREFKTSLVTIAIIFVALFLYTKLAGPIPFYVNSVTTTQSDLFTVDGTGTVTAIPDSATVNLGVTQTATTVTDAQDKTNSVANKLIEDIKKLGIAEKDIKTTNYSVVPNYSSNPSILYQGQGAGVAQAMPPIQGGSEQQIIGYTVTQNIEVNVKPIEKANKVVDTATSDGANLVGGVNFSFSDTLKNKLENQARADAIGQAKQKAQNLSSLSGIRLGRLVNVVESNQNPWPMPLEAGVMKAGSQGQQTNITPGESTVTITVTLSYETY